MSTATLLWLVLLGCVIAFLGLTIRALVWVNDRHATPVPPRNGNRLDNGAIAHWTGGALPTRRIAARPINGPNLRPDVLYFKGATDGEIADKFLEDAWGHRRSEA